jgi:hypothetical protein
MTQDVTILYQGGSGGFALYYYLLLTGQFQHSIEETWQLIDQQFPAELGCNHRAWKNYESWPNNVELKKQSGRKLFLICNPLWSDDMIEVNHSVSDDTHRILLYTDFRLQLRMAWEKQAYWFTAVSKQAFRAPNNDRDYIRWIKKSAIKFNGSTVDCQVPTIIDKFRPAEIVQLKDLLTQPCTIDQQKFLDRWINLQPKKTQHLMNL